MSQTRAIATRLRPLGTSLAVASVVLPVLVVSSYARGWMETDPRPGEWGAFAPAGASLLRGDLAAVFHNRGVQAGPLQLIPFGAALLGGVSGNLQWTICYSLALFVVLVGFLIACFPAPEKRTLLAFAPQLAAAVVISLGNILPAATINGHPAQIIAPMLWIAAARASMSGRPFLAGSLVGIAAGWETWGILGVVVIFCAHRPNYLRSGLGTVAALAVLYGPFVLSGNFHMFQMEWQVSSSSLESHLWPGLESFPWSLRVLQAIASLALGVIVALRTRGEWYSPAATVLATLGGRLVLDPVLHGYYWLAPAAILVVIVGHATHRGRYVLASGAAATAVWLAVSPPRSWTGGLILVLFVLTATLTIGGQSRLRTAAPRAMALLQRRARSFAARGPS